MTFFGKQNTDRAAYTVQEMQYIPLFTKHIK
jgi:hypothetical protein